jgi:hypothetical protein
MESRGPRHGDVERALFNKLDANLRLSRFGIDLVNARGDTISIVPP